MKIHLLCKRYYTGKDLIRDRFGRLYHLPVQLSQLGLQASVTAIDYRHPLAEQHELDGVIFRTLPATATRLPGSLIELQRTLRADPPDMLLASGDSHIGYLGLRLARGLVQRGNHRETASRRYRCAEHAYGSVDDASHPRSGSAIRAEVSSRSGDGFPGPIRPHRRGGRDKPYYPTANAPATRISM